MPTLTTYRQRAAREMGPFLSSTATSGSTTGQIEDTAWPVKSAASIDDLYEDQFVFRPSGATADKTRIVLTYTPSTGVLVPDTAWSAGPSNGEAYELHGLVAPLDLHRLINQGLKRILLPVEFTVTPVTDQIRHSLATAASWLTDPDWVCQVGYLTSGDDRDEIDPFARVVRGSAYKDGATVYILHPGRSFNATDDTIYVRAMKPAYYHCKVSGGSYGGQSGLSLETDEAEPTEEWVAAAAIVEAWREFGHLLEPGVNQGLIRSRTEAAQWFTQETNKNYQPWGRTLRSLIAFGPRR